MSELKPGTCVEIRNLTSEKGKVLNGKLGVVKKYHDESKKTYRILLGYGETEVAIKREKLIVIENCPNETKENRTPFIIWPEIPEFDKPIVQWFNQNPIKENTHKEFFDKWEKETRQVLA